MQWVVLVLVVLINESLSKGICGAVETTSLPWASHLAIGDGEVSM